jgi:GMP synthase (glutamine-hydrolysing)
MILVIKHIAIEGPGTLGEFLQAHGFALQTVELDRGELLPRKTKDLKAVVCLGGPMNVYEEEQYPFLRDENVFIQEILKKGIPFLGICLGSQLLAKAAGAKVMRAKVAEIGFFPVRLTAEGQNDRLFAGLPDSFEVFQWHGDTFDIPSTGTWLAAGEQCSHQAFRVGEKAYGLQFHVEIMGQTIEQWAKAYFKKGNSQQKTLRQQMLYDFANKKETFNTQANRIYNNFLEIIGDRK